MIQYKYYNNMIDICTKSEQNTFVRSNIVLLNNKI